MPYYYLILFVCISILALLEAFSIEPRLKRPALFFVIAVLIFTSGLKYETGVDWKEYSFWFYDIFPIDRIFDADGRENIFEKIDWGYNILCSTIKFLGGSIQTVFFVVALISGVFLYEGIKQFTPFPISSLLVYYALLFFTLDLNGIRQGLALCIFLYSLRFVVERRFLKYLLFIFLASSFHWSALFFLPLYFLLDRRYSSSQLTTVLVISFLIFIFKIEWIANVIYQVFSFSESKEVIDRALVYTSNPLLASSRALDFRTLANILFNILIFIVLILNRKKLEEKYRYFNLFLNIYLIQMFIYFSLYEIIALSERLKLYTWTANIVLLPYFYGLFRARWEKLLPYFAVVLYSFIFSSSYILEKHSTISYHPYQNYLIYKAFDLNSTGKERLREQARVFNSYE